MKMAVSIQPKALSQTDPGLVFDIVGLLRPLTLAGIYVGEVILCLTYAFSIAVGQAKLIYTWEGETV